MDQPARALVRPAFRSRISLVGVRWRPRYRGFGGFRVFPLWRNSIQERQDTRAEATASIARAATRAGSEMVLTGGCRPLGA
jgi:hypothetical protein